MFPEQELYFSTKTIHELWQTILEWDFLWLQLNAGTHTHKVGNLFPCQSTSETQDPARPPLLKQSCRLKSQNYELEKA